MNISLFVNLTLFSELVSVEEFNFNKFRLTDFNTCQKKKQK